VIGQRWRAWWQSRLPRTDTLTLHQRNIYILPTRPGLMFAVTVATLLLASINFQLNLGYVLTFLLAGSGLVSMHQTHNTLRGLHLQLRAVEDVWQGEPARLEITLCIDRGARDTGARYGVGLRLQDAGDDTLVWVDLPAMGQASVTLLCPQTQRGEIALPALQVQTRFPLGLFRAWSIWRPAGKVWVYPTAEAAPPALPAPQAGVALAPTHTTGQSQDLDEVRPYRRGDPPQHLAWKKAAAAMASGSELVSRTGSGQMGADLWLDYADCAPLHREARLSRLAAWVGMAEGSAASGGPNLRYGLRLPGMSDCAPAQGPQHRQAVLRALAAMPAGDRT
jgi:uncharacterized protein (DUF58 family)